MKAAYFTICAKNYLAYALTLYQSVQRIDAERPFYIFLSDELDGTRAPSGPNLHIIEGKELGLPAYWDMAFRYSVLEFATAIKPGCFSFLFDQQDMDAAIYLDPDIYVSSALEEVFEAFSEGASAVLTPHTTTPYNDTFQPDDLQIMRSGIFNLGFGAFRNTPEARSFVDWWGKHLETDCRVDIEKGLFVDQKFMDFAPAFLNALTILKHPGYNIAYWNLHERTIKNENKGWIANDLPVRFFHFSGIVPEAPIKFSKHQTRFEMASIGDLAEMATQYCKALSDNNHSLWKTLSYKYDKFRTGEKIPTIARRAYGEHIPSNPALTFEEAFSIRPDIFSISPNTSPVRNGTAFSLLEHQALVDRLDLRGAFELEDPATFKHWFSENAAKEFALPEKLLESDHQQPQTGLKSIAAKQAGSILSAAPTLRPLYAVLPVGLRSIVKRTLLKTYTGSSERGAVEQVDDANGRFDPALKPGVQFYGYLGSQSGIGTSARGNLAAMQTAGIPVHPVTLVNPSDPRETGKASIDFGPDQRIAFLNFNAEQSIALHELVTPARLKGRYRIAYWAWELDCFPSAWHPAFDVVDEIWVPSNFVKQVISSSTSKPVHVIPHVVCTDYKDSFDGLPDINSPSTTLFMTAFDYNSYIDRKNPVAAIKAYMMAFPDDDPSKQMLIVKTQGTPLEGQHDQIKACTGARQDILFINAQLTRDAVMTLTARTNCFLALHRSEGFGLQIAEAMALGVPVIVTDYSGSSDFVDAKVGMPIPHQLIDVPPGSYPNSENALWADPDITKAADAIRFLGANPSVRATLGAAGRNRVLERYSPTVIGEVIRDRISEIDSSLT